jgi:hypothetical protein
VNVIAVFAASLWRKHKLIAEKHKLNLLIAEKHKLIAERDYAEPRSGVRCTTSRESDAFYVEMTGRAKSADLPDADVIKKVDMVVRAIAGAWESRGRRDVSLEVAPSSCAVGGRPTLLMTIRMISDAPVSCTGTWVGNVISKVLDTDLCSRSLVNVDVQPLLVRAAVVQRNVLTCQEHWALQSLGKAPAEPCLKGEAALWRWDPKSSAMSIDVVEAHDDDAEAPVRVIGISTVREQKKNAAKDSSSKDSSSSNSSNSNKDPAKSLELVLASLSSSAVSAVRRRIAERDALVQGSSERAKVQAWLDHVARLPVPRKAEGSIDMSADLENAAKKLDKVVHGLEDAKSAVLQIVGQVIRAPDAPVRALGLCGPPGCGKTSLAVRGIGAALKDRPVRVIGLGGAKDSSVLLGHDYTYSGSRPGRVLDAVCSAGVSDCVLVFDELDKLSDTASGKEVASVLMSIVDPTQNKAFEDTYLIGVPIDLSRVVCVFTFNDISLVDPILLDRLHIVHVHELSVAEKKKVVQSRMLPEIAKSLGVDNVTIDDECVTLLLQNLKGGSFRGAEKALEHAILSANVRTIREKRSVDGSNPLKIEHDDLPKHSTSKDFISTMYA